MNQQNKNIKPDFLYIGASKAGSSWLFECLRAHPEIFIPIAKDLQFFNLYYDKGTDWYQAFFDTKDAFLAYGEMSHDYFLSAKTAQRIYDFNPNIKLIACLRNPVDKILSNYNYAKRTYLDKQVSFDEFFNNHSKYKKDETHNMGRENANYYENLASFYKLFPSENILILFYDDLKSHPENFIQKVYSFLEVDKNFIPTMLNTTVNPNQDSRNSAVAHIAYKVAAIVRQIGLSNVVGAIKRNRIVNTILYQNRTSDKKENLTDVELKMVNDYYKTSYSKLVELIGKELPEEWYYQFNI